MCLLSVAWQSSAEYPFVFAGNRDEHHGRASAAADWWAAAPDVLGGRDLVAGGSWLGIRRDGRFAVVTNRPDQPPPATDALSRGALVSNWLGAAVAGKDNHNAIELLAQQNNCYGGFSLLAGSIAPHAGATLNCYSGGNGSSELTRSTITAGIFGLSNTAADKPWPKLSWLNQQMRSMANRPEPDALFRLLLRDTPVPDAPTDGVAARPFIKGEAYGTRSATVIVLDKAGVCRFFERRFGPGGQPAGDSTFEFQLSF